MGGTLDYAIITKTAFSTNTTLTVQVPEGCTIPTSGGVGAVAYSTTDSPFGFPADSGRWLVEIHQRAAGSQSAPVAATWYNPGSTYITAPIGAWKGRYEVVLYADVSAGSADASVTLSTANNSESDLRMSARMFLNSTPSHMQFFTRAREYNLSSATVYYLNTVKNGGTLNSINFLGTAGTTVISFELAYL